MEEQSASRERLQASCQDLERRLMELRNEVSSFEMPPTGSAIERLRAEECILRAQLATLKSSSPTAGTLDKRVLHERAIAEVQRCNEGLTQTLSHLEGKKRELQNSLKEYAKEAEQLSSLQQCYQRFSSDRLPGPSELEELQMYKQRSREIEEHLLDFLETFYPQPTSDDTAGQQKKAKRSGSRSSVDGRANRDNTVEAESLQTLLERLSSQALRHPEDPYVTITERTWPPYVELLRRSGIIGEHPDDSSRIKLLHGNG